MVTQADAMMDAIKRAYEDGARVAIMLHSGHAARVAQWDCMDLLEEFRLPSEVNRTSGRERVTFPSGGMIQFRSLKASDRGYSFDRVYVPRDAPAGTATYLRPTLLVSGGAMVEYGPAKVVAA